MNGSWAKQVAQAAAVALREQEDRQIVESAMRGEKMVVLRPVAVNVGGHVIQPHDPRLLRVVYLWPRMVAPADA